MQRRYISWEVKACKKKGVESVIMSKQINKSYSTCTTWNVSFESQWGYLVVLWFQVTYASLKYVVSCLVTCCSPTISQQKPRQFSSRKTTVCTRYSTEHCTEMPFYCKHNHNFTGWNIPFRVCVHVRLLL